MTERFRGITLEEYRQEFAYPQSEAEFQAQVIRLAKAFDWRYYHTFDSRASVPGFPDLVLVRADRLIFAELKGRRGRVRAEQQRWLTDLRRTRKCEVYVWRPADMKQIASVLR